MSKVSIIMPVYNGAKYLKDAIKSILEQSHTDFEFIIVNDGSTDDSEGIIKSFFDNRIKYFKKENSGIVDTLNFALEKSSGEFVARMDADDICMLNRLEKQLEFFKNNPEIVLIGTWAEKIDSGGNSIGEMKYPPTKSWEIKKYGLMHNPFIHSSIMFRKDLISCVGFYNKNYLHNEDYELWTRIIYKYFCFNLDEKLIKYRIHDDSLTKKNHLSMRIVGIKVRVLALFRFLFGSIL